MIGTRDQSEIRLNGGPVIDKGLSGKFVPAHEDAGFDRVLIGYASSQPDGLQVAAYAAAHTERLGGSSEAACRVGGKHADTCALWGEPLAESVGVAA